MGRILDRAERVHDVVRHGTQSTSEVAKCGFTPHNTLQDDGAALLDGFDGDFK